MKRGFKSQCERRSVEARKLLGLQPHEPLNGFELARVQKVSVWSESDVAELPAEDVRQLTVDAGDDWLAFTLRLGTDHLVVYNSSQSVGRVNSMLMHELAHIMLGHELTSAGLSEDGYLMPTTYDQEQEDEANWFGGTLLLPRPALLRVRGQNMDDQQIRQRYSVTQEMINWRFRMTGVDYQLANSRR